MKVLIITSNFPSERDPDNGVFVLELVRQLVRENMDCRVIYPASLLKSTLHGSRRIELENGKSFFLDRPPFLSLSNRGGVYFNTRRLTYIFFSRSVRKMVRKLEFEPDLVYAHFLYPPGGTAIRLSEILNCPAIVASGESSLWTLQGIGKRKARTDYSRVTRLIAVSTPLASTLHSTLHIPLEKIRVIPNGVDLSHFFPRNKNQCRVKLGLPEDKFIIAFVGQFTNRKGPHRLLEAVKSMADTGVLFLGSGAIPLEGKQILLKQRVDHHVLPEYLSAADIFVLPTLAEGSSNATLEALACGLPVVSSNLPFHDDILNEQVSIRVDTSDPSQIQRAIEQLKTDSQLRETMVRQVLDHIQQFDLKKRASRIIEMFHSTQSDRNRNNEPYS